jgi:hypothetical protein
MKLTRFHCLRILEWCEQKYGRSRYNRGHLTLEFKKPTYINEGLLGEYDSIENLIWINSVDHESLEDLCQTIIEEYTHYLNSDKEYQRLYEKHDYENHPHEIYSKAIAESDYKECLSDLAKEHKQFTQ